MGNKELINIKVYSGNEKPLVAPVVVKYKKGEFAINNPYNMEGCRTYNITHIPSGYSVISDIKGLATARSALQGCLSLQRLKIFPTNMKDAETFTNYAGLACNNKEGKARLINLLRDLKNGYITFLKATEEEIDIIINASLKSFEELTSKAA